MCAPPAAQVGWLADRMNRRNLLLYVILFGEVPCLLTYWVTAYWQFFLLRTLTGMDGNMSSSIMSSSAQCPADAALPALHALPRPSSLPASSHVDGLIWSAPPACRRPPCLINRAPS